MQNISILLAHTMLLNFYEMGNSCITNSAMNGSKWVESL